MSNQQNTQNHQERYGRQVRQDSYSRQSTSERSQQPRQQSRRRRRRRNRLLNFNAVLVLLFIVALPVMFLAALELSSEELPDTVEWEKIGRAMSPGGTTELPDGEEVPVDVTPDPEDSENEPIDAVETFAANHNLSLRDYPQSVLELLERNPEAQEFVFNYPLEYGKDHEIDLSDYENIDGVPLFIQWDKRWGYIDYGSDVAGITGCGPVTLAMAGYYLTGDDKFRPDKIIDFAIEEGYCVPGSGSSWSLISEGGVKLGLDVIEIPLDENRMKKNLNVGNLIICIMGPGDFTTSGHFILLTGVEDGKFRVNDANSYINSEKLWSYEDIKGQIKNLWVIR